jgi:tetratricopeptide (TPR) repeat protein
MKADTKTRCTLGLAMIMKDEVEDLDRIINDYGRFFDKIYVTVTDKNIYDTLHKKFNKNSEAYKKAELSFFKWIDHFGKARTYNTQQVRTDYWMWIDLDDEIEGANNIPTVLEYMVTNNLDAVWFQYDYAPRVTLSDPASISWRERIIKTASNLTWKDEAIHEYINIQEDIRQDFLSQVVIKHRKTAEQLRVTGERNRIILEKDWQRSHRAITAWYMGKYLTRMGDYEGAIEKFLFVTEQSEIKPERFRAWQALGDIYIETGNYEASLDAANEGIAIYPDHPGPWYLKFAVYAATGDYDTALQSAEIALSKRIEGEMARYSHDPSKYEYRGPFAVAQAHLLRGNIERAYELYLQVKKTTPEYIDEASKAMGVQWGIVFEQAHRDKLTED